VKCGLYLRISIIHFTMKVEKEIPFHEQLVTQLDGRTNRWLADKTKIHESEISRIVSGRLTPTEKQLTEIKAVFPAINYSL